MGKGRLVCKEERWNQHMTSILSKKDGRFEIAIVQGEPSTKDLPELDIDWELRETKI